MVASTWNYHSVFQRNWTILNSQQQHMALQVTPLTHQHLVLYVNHAFLFFVFLMIWYYENLSTLERLLLPGLANSWRVNDSPFIYKPNNLEPIHQLPLLSKGSHSSDPLSGQHWQVVEQLSYLHQSVYYQGYMLLGNTG